MPPTVTLYTREGCHLCHEAHIVIEQVRRARPFELTVVDIDRELGPDDPRFATYTVELPVIEVNGRKAFKFRVEREALEKALARPTGS